MGLFSKKKEETKSCCCGGNCTPETMAQAEAAKAAVGVKVLGTGCAKCNALENAVRAALTELGMDTTIDPCDGLHADRRLRGHDHAGAGGGWKSGVLWQGIKERRSERANPESKRVKSKSVAGECGCISPLFVV